MRTKERTTTEAYRTRLESFVGRLREAIAAGDAGIAQLAASQGDEVTGQHPADTGTDLFLMERALTDGWTMRRDLALAEEALARIADGTFGTCVECGRPIAQERLEVRPFAARCVECARRQENAGRPRRARSSLDEAFR